MKTTTHSLCILVLALVFGAWIGGNSTPPVPVIIHSPAAPAAPPPRNLPYEVTCGGYKYSIEYKTAKEMPGYFGRIYYDMNQIFILEGLPLDREQETLYHELEHCVIQPLNRLAQLKDDTTGVEVVHLNVDQWIEVVSPDMLAVLRDNPKVTAYLLQK